MLTLYQQPRDVRFPVVNMDERFPVQLLAEKRAPLPLVPGHAMRVDHEYVRQGTASVFLFTDALRGWRKVSVRARRTALDWAEEIKHLLDEEYPEAEQVLLICDNLNTHKLASLYKAFEASEASRLCRRLALHHTPKHGSWLNIAEIELSVFKRQCLCRRIPDLKTLGSEAAAWVAYRNAETKCVDWRFTTEDARIRLNNLEFRCPQQCFLLRKSVSSAVDFSELSKRPLCELYRVSKTLLSTF